MEPSSTTGVRIWHEVSRRACAEVAATLDVFRQPTQRYQQLQNLTNPIVKSCSILNAPLSLQVLSGACENALAESESTLQNIRGGWEHLDVLKSTAQGNQSVWKVCVWFPDQITFCWCCSVPDLPTLQGYFPTKSTMVTPCHHSQSAVCISLPLPLRWKSRQDPFHLPPALLAYQNPKPTSSRWTIWPKPGAPESSFRAGLELTTCGLDHGHQLIGESNGHSAAWQPPRDTHVELCCWWCWDQYSITNWYDLHQRPPRHPLAPDVLLQLGQSSVRPGWSLSVAPRYVRLMCSYSGAPEIYHQVRHFKDNQLDPINMWNIINSIHSIRTYINTTVSLFLTCLLIHHSFIFIEHLRSLGILISSGA